ncbi:ligand-binding sensor domain-containing diguanylate cyclase [Pseudoxanthomonas wuyuanensis]|uniref:diguanylate cyclase n=1 Tax=Pseudoxanthomonas wuyuanensis TaxID=1073196 RepID=A0A286DFK0_9GAMM|nr:ligand-binding sensor domain-containing diguanylate cyclase [Pseudoxanthomonas wuyuanensis]KAF1718967.1 GGDEF domain-containing protein [Pseudoxanthomonas wuyuanensis]SOD57537.1 diguanylate cyclase (GGDEF) domain-containing protein [Pseudoxanthomonas wuyuanensis]
MKPALLARWLLCLLLLAPWHPLLAAPPGAATAPPLRDYVGDRWTSRQGLPHNSLRDMAQTPEGHLWFATWEGLVRYNGVEFEVYGRGTEPSLPDNGVGSLYVDAQGALWLSDSRGNLGRRTADGQWRFWNSGDDWPQALIHAMTMDRQGRMWLLFEGHGLGCLHPDGRFEYFGSSDDVPLRQSFPKMAVDDKDRIWIGGLKGLIYRDAAGSFHRAPAAFGLPPGLAWPYRAPDGTIWIVAGESLYRIRGDAAERLRQLPGHGHFTAMLQDRRGDLWLGSENRGLLRIGPHGVEYPPAGEMNPPGRIVSLLEDAEGSIWAGANGGLFRLRETLFGRYTRRDGLSGDYVRALLEDRHGRLWVGGANGLDRIDGDGQVRPVALQPGQVPPSVLSLAETGEGQLWVGSYADGVFQLRDGQPVRRYGPAEGLPAGHIRAIVPADGGGVWAGTQRGPVLIESGQVRTPRIDGLPQALVTALANIDGALWIGSVEGASVLRDGQVRRVPLETLSGARSVFGFQRIGNDVWIATDRGLYRERAGTLARVGLEQGLPVDTVFQIVADRIGNGWISSNRGVLRARMADLDAVADGRLARLPVERYDETDGMSSAQGNGSSAPSMILRGDGTVWLVTAAGVSLVDPQRWRSFSSRVPPPAEIENVTLDGKPFAWRQRAPHHPLPGGSRISVSYAGLSYLLPERIRYRTWLEGLDAGWVERGRQRSVDFVGLPPGDYALHVAAAHPEGAWSEREAVWKFSVAPLWWQRASVRIGGLALLTLALAGLFRYRLIRYRTRNRRLARLVQQRTEQLQAQTDQLLQADRDKTELLAQLRRQAETFERQAREDALTALPNRRHFDEVLLREFARARRGDRPLCLMILDIDHFKTINDGHSHAVGDKVLREVGQLLATICRASDFAARVGGEEFTMVLPDTGIDEALSVAARLRERFASQRDWGGVAGLAVTFSGGMVQLEPTDNAPAEMLRRADEALYDAKTSGRDRICTQ